MAANKEATKPRTQRDKDKEKMTTAIVNADADGIIKAARFDPKNIIGNLADAMIAEEKAAKHRKDWEKLEEEEQQERIEAAHTRAKEFVAGVVGAIFEGGGVASVECNIGKVDYEPGKETAKVTCVIVQSPETLEHFSNGVSRAKFVFADTAQFEGPMVTEALPSQNALALDDPPPKEPEGKEAVSATP